MHKFLSLIYLLLISLSVHAQYAFELEVDFAHQIGNTENYSVSGQLLKGKIASGTKYYLSSGAELQVINVMSAATATSVPEVVAPDRVSVGLICKKFTPQQHVVLKGISTQPNMNGQFVQGGFTDKLPEGMLKVNINGMQFTALQVSKPIKTKASDILDMFYKTKSGGVFWLQIANLSKVETLPARLVADSTLIGGETPYCKIAFMPDGFLPTDLPNNYKGYEDKFGQASILITNLKKYTFSGTIEFGGPLRPNQKMLEENEKAGPLQLTNGRVDKLIWDEH